MVANLKTEATATPPEAPSVFDAFVSYSRKDKQLAVALTKALEAYKPPKDMALPARHLEIFQDEADFTGVEYFASVERHLTSSGSLIVICSPNARRSQYVNDEIRRFGASRGADRIVPVLCAGLPNNEAEGRDEEKAFPDALCELMRMPLAINYVGFDPGKDKVNKGAFENSWYTLLANIFRVSRSEIEQRDKRRQARARRIRMGIIGAFVASICIGLVVSLYSWRQAVLARDTAFSRELAAQAEGQAQTDVDLSVKLALEALRVSRTSQAEAALREAMVGSRVLAVMNGERASTAVSLSPNRDSLLGGDDKGELRLWRVDSGDLVAEWPGHTDLIANVAFSADGKRAVTASWDGTARIWNLAAGLPDKTPTHTLKHAEAPVDSAQFSPDGASVATADGDGVVRVWDASGGKLLHTIAAHSWDKNVVYGTARVLYSPDGSQLLSSAGSHSTAIGDPVARLWDARSGKLLRQFPSPSGVIMAAQFSADGTRVFTMGDRGGVRVWDAATAQPIAVFDDMTAPLEIGVASPDGSSVLTADGRAGRMGNVVVTDVQTRESRQLHGLVTSAAFDSTGKRVATGNDRGAVVWDARTGEMLHDLRGHFGDVKALAFGANDATLITTSEDRSARVWDLRNSGKELVISGKGDGSIGPVFSADGRWLAAQTAVATVVWDAQTGTEIASVESGSYKKLDAQFDPRGRLLAVHVRATASRSEEIRNAAGQPVLTTVSMPEYVYAFSPDGKSVVTANDNYSLTIRDSSSWKELRTLEGHKSRLGGAVYGHDGKWILTAAEDSSARVWEVESGKSLHEFRLDNRGYEVHLSPDGQLACVVEDWNTIKLWDTNTWKIVHTFTWPAPASGGNWAKRARFSPDGALLAVGDNRGTLHILDVAARKERATIDAHRYSVDTLAFGPDGRFILTTGGGDRGARVWDAVTGASLAVLGTLPVVGAAFRPGGGQIATFGSDGTVRFFNEPRYRPIEELIQLATARVKRELTPRERAEYLHEKVEEP